MKIVWILFFVPFLFLTKPSFAKIDYSAITSCKGNSMQDDKKDCCDQIEDSETKRKCLDEIGEDDKNDQVKRCEDAYDKYSDKVEQANEKKKDDMKDAQDQLVDAQNDFNDKMEDYQKQVSDLQKQIQKQDIDLQKRLNEIDEDMSKLDLEGDDQLKTKMSDVQDLHSQLIESYSTKTNQIYIDYQRKVDQLNSLCKKQAQDEALSILNYLRGHAQDRNTGKLQFRSVTAGAASDKDATYIKKRVMKDYNDCLAQKTNLDQDRDQQLAQEKNTQDQLKQKIQNAEDSLQKYAQNLQVRTNKMLSDKQNESSRAQSEKMDLNNQIQALQTKIKNYQEIESKHLDDLQKRADGIEPDLKKDAAKIKKSKHKKDEVELDYDVDYNLAKNSVIPACCCVPGSDGCTSDSSSDADSTESNRRSGQDPKGYYVGVKNYSVQQICRQGIQKGKRSSRNRSSK